MPGQNGTRLGPYEIETPLGAGGMGEVYRALDRDNRTIAALSHPNILAVYDVGQHDGTPYAVLELLEGETLRVTLDRAPLARATIFSYAKQIASGLAAAHAKDIVHRDLKPDNILVTPSGIVKILDFGLARVATADDGETRLGATSQASSHVR